MPAAPPALLGQQGGEGAARQRGVRGGGVWGPDPRRSGDSLAGELAWAAARVAPGEPGPWLVRSSSVGSTGAPGSCDERSSSRSPREAWLPSLAAVVSACLATFLQPSPSSLVKLLFRPPPLLLLLPGPRLLTWKAAWAALHTCFTSGSDTLAILPSAASSSACRDPPLPAQSRTESTHGERTVVETDSGATTRPGPVCLKTLSEPSTHQRALILEGSSVSSSASARGVSTSASSPAAWIFHSARALCRTSIGIPRQETHMLRPLARTTRCRTSCSAGLSSPLRTKKIRLPPRRSKTPARRPGPMMRTAEGGAPAKAVVNTPHTPRGERPPGRQRRCPSSRARR
mmetsp:Transcript_23704/g.75119  ORF Transcript_23704/g.75119 Transcript_23704/m.75119 type:complete len:344 (+) Transcript_23704:995-2026(+)